MSIFKRSDLDSLVRQRGDYCISIYVPADPANTRKNQIYFKDMVKEAREELEEAGLRRPEVDEILGPADALLSDSLFWNSQNGGMSCFISKGFFKIISLPDKVGEYFSVSGRFHIKPLLPLYNIQGRFYLLALSQNQVRLYQCTRDDIDEIKPEEMPESYSEVRKHYEYEANIHTRSASLNAGKKGESAAMFYGQGGKEDEKVDIDRYVRLVEIPVMEVLKEESAPLVLAGDDYILSAYRKVNNYNHLLDDAISGNPELLNEKEIHAKAWALVEPVIKHKMDGALGELERLIGTGHASASIDAIIPAAYNGRISSLFITQGQEEWGRYNPETNEVMMDSSPAPGNEDLLDFAAAYTIINGGEVYTVEPGTLPDVSSAAASFRY